LPPTLTANEARVIGCLMEKSVLTPDQYPMTLNALTNACNQKTGRNPVTSLDPGVVQRTARDLQAKLYVRVEENFKRGTEKYRQRLCNTSQSDYRFDNAEFAIVCLLLLRGAQTPGELRAHSGRLHDFADNRAVSSTLTALIQHEGGPLVTQLPRTPGRKDSEFMHLLFGPVDVEAHAQAARDTATAGSATEGAKESDLEERVGRLEAEVAELKALLHTNSSQLS
jgi:uncharacterized protein YceH (UPF0502 family)